MIYRELGRTGMKVSALGFGGWQLGGTWGGITEDAAVATLLRAFERGINFVDTAPRYGEGTSESRIGKALREWKGPRIFVATKVAPVRVPDADDHAAPMRGCYPPEHVRLSVEGSLRRLGVERIDLLQLHQWIPRGLVELEWLEGLNALRLEGKVAHIGASLRDIRPAPGVPLARLGLVSTLQVMFNLFEQEPLDELFPAAAATQTGVIVRVPLDSGALSGAWTKDTYDAWSPGDIRRRMYADGRLAETLRRVGALSDVVRRYYPDLAEAALRFALHPACVATVLVGMRDPGEVDRNLVHVDNSPLPPGFLEAIRPHAWKHEFYQR